MNRIIQPNAGDMERRLTELAAELQLKRQLRIEGFAKAFFDSTGLKPEEAELVETRDETANTITWSFRKKIDETHHI